MVAYKNILFCTDFSESAQAAVPFAVDLAKKYGRNFTSSMSIRMRGMSLNSKYPPISRWTGYGWRTSWARKPKRSSMPFAKRLLKRSDRAKKTAPGETAHRDRRLCKRDGGGCNRHVQPRFERHRTCSFRVHG